MNVTPEEMREIKDHISKLERLNTKLSKLVTEVSSELDILNRRVAFINHPAGRALSAEQIKEKRKLRESTNQPGSYSAEILNFPHKEN